MIKKKRKIKMKKILNEWRKFLNENEGERYYIRKMEPVSYEEAIDLIKDPRLKAVTQTQEDPGREYYKIEMSDGEILVGDYDPAEQDMRVYDENDEEAGEEYDRAALEFIQDELDERCQKGYKTHPTRKTKKMYGKTYRNCVKAE